MARRSLAKRGPPLRGSPRLMSWCTGEVAFYWIPQWLLLHAASWARGDRQLVIHLIATWQTRNLIGVLRCPGTSVVAVCFPTHPGDFLSLRTKTLFAHFPLQNYISEGSSIIIGIFTIQNYLMSTVKFNPHLNISSYQFHNLQRAVMDVICGATCLSKVPIK